ncbi:unnamed protein product, partial [Sphagnum jensenii]
MQQEGVRPSSVTFVRVLKACASVVAIEEGRCIHQQIFQSGLESDVFVGSTLVDILVDMYAKCGSMEDAWRVFNKLPSWNVISWTAMIFGHVKCGQGQEALELFQEMQQEGVQPNSVTFGGVLNACASMVALEEDRCAHEQTIQSGFESDVFVGNSLVDMYAKCGSMEDAWSVFNKMPSRNVVTWTAILGGCAIHGHEYTISAKSEHYTCMVDLLGHAGHLQEAENMAMAMPCEPHVSAWRALLSACRIHGNVEMAECIAKQILELEPDNAAGYVLLSNIYATAGNRHLCENVEQPRKEKGVKKQPGCTWI